MYRYRPVILQWVIPATPFLHVGQNRSPDSGRRHPGIAHHPSRRVPGRRAAPPAVRRRIGQGMVASGKTPGLPCAKSKSRRLSPRFRPAQVSQRCCHGRIHRRRPEGRSRSAGGDSCALSLGPMRSGNLCPVRSGPGDHEIQQLHQAIARTGALLPGRRQADGRENKPPVTRLQLPARQ